MYGLSLLLPAKKSTSRAMTEREARKLAKEAVSGEYAVDRRDLEPPQGELPQRRRRLRQGHDQDINRKLPNLLVKEWRRRAGRAGG